MLKSTLLAGIACFHATANEGQPATDDGIPAALRRSPTEPGQIAPGQKTAAKPVTPQVKAIPGTAPLGIKPAKAKAAPKAKPGKVVKAKHKPSEVTATEANPQKSIVPVRFKERYADHGDSNGDRVAHALKSATLTKNADGRPSVDLEALHQIAEANGIDWKAYTKLNAGMQRMNIGNRLRGMLKNEKGVVIGKQRFSDWEKAKVIVPPKAKDEAKAAA